MPVITVEMWKGRTDEQKATLIRGITEVFEKIGAAKDQTTVILNEHDKSNWGMKGVQASKQ